MAIKIAQTSTAAGKDHWRWSVWLDAPDAELDQVDHVVYTLHPTFSQAVRLVSDRESAFRLDASGWGEFAIHAAVHHRDQRVVTLEHWLTLHSDVADWLAKARGTAPRRAGRLHGESRAATRGGPPPRVYLSFSLADALSAAAIRKWLHDHGEVEVTTSEEIAQSSTGMPFEQLIQHQLKSVSRAVFLVSEHSSPWLRREAETAERLGIPLAIVTVGDAPAPRPDVQTLATLRVRGPDPLNAPEVAEKIARWARGAG